MDAVSSSLPPAQPWKGMEKENGADATPTTRPGHTVTQNVNKPHITVTEETTQALCLKCHVTTRWRNNWVVTRNMYTARPPHTHSPHTARINVTVTAYKHVFLCLVEGLGQRKKLSLASSLPATTTLSMFWEYRLKEKGHENSH